MSSTQKTEIAIVTEETIKDKIYFIRGQKVMLDSDLAVIYGYETRYFNRQVKNNIEKFEGDDFMFQLSAEEFNDLMCKNFTSSSGWGGMRKRPYAFTESGIYMLMTVLKGELAIRQSRALICLFRQMKEYILDSQGQMGTREFLQLSVQTNENTRAIHRIEASMVSKDDLVKFMVNFTDNHIGREFLILDGKTVEAAIAYAEIYGLAKKSIYIVDNYIGIKTLLPLRDIRKGVGVIVFSDNIGKMLTKHELNDFQKEYPNIQISLQTTGGKFHDRFIILDFGTKVEKIYHCGASSKDAGKRITAISKMNDVKMYESMVKELLNNSSLILK